MENVQIHSLVPPVSSMIPNEIYNHIFDFLSPNDDITHLDSKRVLSNLSLVCKLFSSLALPRLFRSLKIDVCPHEPTKAPFSQALMENQEPARLLAQHVEHMSIHLYNNKSADTHHAPAFDGRIGIYIKSVGNLRSLSISGMVIDEHLLKTIGELQHLHSLEVGHECSLSIDLFADTMQDLSKLKLEELQLFSDNDVQLSILNHIEEACLKELTVALPAYILYISTRKCPLNLEKLSFSFPFSGTQRAIFGYELNFSHTPLLRDLDILSTSLSAAETKHFTSDVLPNLKRIRVNMSNATLILDVILGENRPTEDVTIKETHDGKEIQLNQYERVFAALKRHPANIRVLKITARLLLQKAATFEGFVKLEILTIFYDFSFAHDFGSDEPAISMIKQTFKNQCSFPKNLRQLRFIETQVRIRGHLWDLKKQHEVLVTELSAKLPNLNLCSFVKGVEWHKDPGTMVWKPFVSVYHREGVAKILGTSIW